jgi:hypothetical protein
MNKVKILKFSAIVSAMCLAGQVSAQATNRVALSREGSRAAIQIFTHKNLNASAAQVDCSVIVVPGYPTRCSFLLASGQTFDWSDSTQTGGTLPNYARALRDALGEVGAVPPQTVTLGGMGFTIAYHLNCSASSTCFIQTPDYSALETYRVVLSPEASNAAIQLMTAGNLAQEGGLLRASAVSCTMIVVPGRPYLCAFETAQGRIQPTSSNLSGYARQLNDALPTSLPRPANEQVGVGGTGDRGGQNLDCSLVSTPVLCTLTPEL